MQRLVCLLHMCELPLKNLQKLLDNGTVGPVTTAGPIGCAIENLNENLSDFVDFTFVPSNLPEIDESIFKGTNH